MAGTEMVLEKKIEKNWCYFKGSVSALNTFTEIKDFFGQARIGLAYPLETGKKIIAAHPGIGEVEIEKTRFDTYTVTLLRGKITSRIAGWLGKYR
jgi:hypothetical protein